jgi:hypothetical protein
VPKQILWSGYRKPPDLKHWWSKLKSFLHWMKTIRGFIRTDIICMHYAVTWAYVNVCLSLVSVESSTPQMVTPTDKERGRERETEKARDRNRGLIYSINIISKRDAFSLITHDFKLSFTWPHPCYTAWFEHLKMLRKKMLTYAPMGSGGGGAARCGIPFDRSEFSNWERKYSTY